MTVWRPARAGRQALAAVLWLALQAAVGAAFPKPIGFVNDFAAVLDAPAAGELESLLRSVEQATTAEIVVATVPSLDGMTVEEYANRLFREWGIGKKDKDNGVLVLVAPAAREMRIEVGYGLEPVLPDGLAGEIIRTEFLPRFRDGDYRAGIANGVARLVLVVQRNQTVTPEERRRLLEESDSASGLPLLLMIPFFGLFVAGGFFAVGLGARTKSIFPLLWGGMFGGIPLVMGLGLSPVGTLIVLAPLAAVMAAYGFRLGARPSWVESLRGGKSGDSSDGWVMGGGSSGSSSDGGSGGSFGGGSSGGGGASGRW